MGRRRWVFGLLVALGVSSLAACRSVEEKLVEERARFEERYGPIPTEEELAELRLPERYLAAAELLSERFVEFGEGPRDLAGPYEDWDSVQRQRFLAASREWGGATAVDSALDPSEPEGGTRLQRDAEARLITVISLSRWLRFAATRAAVVGSCELAVERIGRGCDLAVSGTHLPGIENGLLARAVGRQMLLATKDSLRLCSGVEGGETLRLHVEELSKQMKPSEWVWRSALATSWVQFPSAEERLVALNWNAAMIDAGRRDPLEQDERPWYRWLEGRLAESIDLRGFMLNGRLVIPETVEAIQKEPLWRSELDLARAAVGAALQLRQRQMRPERSLRSTRPCGVT